MKRLLVATFAAALLASGCIVTVRSSGDISFTWTFAGASCNQVPQVASVRISIPGETLQDAGVFPCLVGGAPGVTLHDFRSGTYAYTLDGLDAGGQVLFSKSGSVVVNGDVSVGVTLEPVATSASMSWTFPPNAAANNPTCAQAGVAFVDASFDGAAPVRYPCADGQAPGGAQTPSLSVGSHSVKLTAVTAAAYPLYGRQGTLVVQAGAMASNAFPLDWAVGAAEVGWTLSSSSGLNVQCGPAGVQTVHVNFRAADGTWLYGNVPTGSLPGAFSQPGDPQPCNSATVAYDFLLPGTYSVWIGARDATNNLYEPPNTALLPSVTVQAGNFSPMPISLTLIRK